MVERLIMCSRIPMMNPHRPVKSGAVFDGKQGSVTRYKYPQALHYKPVFKLKKHDEKFSIS